MNSNKCWWIVFYQLKSRPTYIKNRLLVGWSSMKTLAWPVLANQFAFLLDSLKTCLIEQLHCWVSWIKFTTSSRGLRYLDFFARIMSTPTLESNYTNNLLAAFALALRLRVCINGLSSSVLKSLTLACLMRETLV